MDFIEIKKILDSDGVIAYPTETVYGLGCNPFSKKAVERVFELKGRKLEQSPIVLIPDQEWFQKLVKEVTPVTSYFVKKYWPGPLTLALSASAQVPNWLLRDDETIALRISSHPWVTSFMKEFKYPLISTSCNKTHEPGSRTLEEVRKYFPQGIDAMIDGGELPQSKGSTIIKIDQQTLSLMRQGDIPFKKLQKEVHGSD